MTNRLRGKIVTRDLSIAWLARFRPEIFWRSHGSLVQDLAWMDRLEALRIVTKTDGARCFAFGWSRQFVDVVFNASIEVIHLLIDHGWKPDGNSLLEAIKIGRLDKIRFLMAAGATHFDEGSLQAALENGNLDVIRFVAANAEGQSISAPSRYYKLENFSMDILLAVDTDQIKPFLFGLLEIAAVEGRLDLIKYLVKCHNLLPKSTALEAASMHGHLDIVKYLAFDAKVEISDAALVKAAKYGHMDPIIFLLRVKPEAIDALIASIGEYPTSIIVQMHKYLPQSCRFNHNLAFGTLLCTNKLAETIECGESLQDLKYFHNNCILESRIGSIDNAAKLGDLEMVKYLHSRPTSRCSTDAMDNAAKFGHLHIVKFLHENRTEGCTPLAMTSAARRGHMNVVKYLYNHRTEGCLPNTLHDMQSPFKNYLEIVKFLVTKCIVEVDEDALLHAIYEQALPVIKFMVDANPALPIAKMIYLCIPGERLDILKFLATRLQDKEEIDGVIALKLACHNPRLEIMKFCYSQWPPSTPVFTDIGFFNPLSSVAEYCAEFKIWNGSDSNLLEVLMSSECYDAIRALIRNGAVSATEVKNLIQSYGVKSETARRYLTFNT
ncbi:hypothetical protein HDU97_007030 [Phlyctochytrium planicorne]|nr:hypothetical protein HDU97_007030 [Phlyctochytrium planicorne]